MHIIICSKCYSEIQHSVVPVSQQQFVSVQLLLAEIKYSITRGYTKKSYVENKTSTYLESMYNVCSTARICITCARICIICAHKVYAA